MRPLTDNRISPRPSAPWLARRKRPSKRDLVALQLKEPRRRHIRYPTRDLQLESPCYGSVPNASLGGMCIESLVALVEGAQYTFHLRHGASFLTVKGRVIWSRIHRTETTRRGRIAIFRTGIEIAPEEARDSWLSALDKLTGVALGA